MNLRSIFGFASGPIAAAVLGLGSVPVIAWVFTPEDIGRFNVLQIALSFALLFSTLGLDQAYVREYHEVKDRAQLLRACFAPGFLLLLVLAAVSCFFAGPLAQWLYADVNPWLTWLTLLAFIIAYLSRFLSLILRMQERGWAYSASQVLPKIVLLLLLAVLAFTAFQKAFIHLQLITLASLAAVLVMYAWNTRTEWWLALLSRIDMPQLKQLLMFGFPLIFSGLAYWGLTATSTIALRSWSTLDELAVYSVANSFAGAAIVFQSIFSVVWAPTVYKWVSQGVNMGVVDQIAQQALAIACVIIALCGALSWVCDFLLPERYAQVKYILLCMMMQPLLYTLSEVTSVGIGVQRKTVFSLWITLAALLANLALSYTLVPKMGAAGAAIANASAFTVFFVGRTEVSARIWRGFPRTRLYGHVVGALALVVATVLFGSTAPKVVHGMWAILLIVLSYSFRGRFSEMIDLLKAKTKVSQTQIRS